MTTEASPRSIVAPRFPFPRYPTGWFQVAWSSELAAGEVKPLAYFGKQLVLFRGEGGEAAVLDAFCPHLGANLALGGKVVGESIVCPFHAWRFDRGGTCVEIPYASRVPPQARLACWPVRELNGCIFVWHDVDRRAPMWELPALPEYGSAEWTAPVHREWKLRTHNQEMAENVVDKAHFKYLHGTVNMPATEVEFDGPLIHMVSPTTMTGRGGEIDGKIESHSYGLGFSTTRFTGIVETLLMGCVAAIDDDLVHVRFTFTVKKLPGEGMEGVVKGVGKAFVAEITRQLEQDAPVWEHKIYLDRPLICDGDGPVGQFRRWASQFYPDWYRDQARAAWDASRA